jgi:hypothetical protein
MQLKIETESKEIITIDYQVSDTVISLNGTTS